MKRISSSLAFVMLVCFMTSVAKAANSSDVNRILSLQHQLVYLPDGQTPQARVSRLLLQLTRLQPQFAPRYFRIAAQKILQENNNVLNRLANRTIRVVKNSELSPQGVVRISLQIEVIAEQETMPSPTPYQAGISSPERDALLSFQGKLRFPNGKDA